MEEEKDLGHWRRLAFGCIVDCNGEGREGPGSARATGLIMGLGARKKVRVHLIHWHADEAKERARRLQTAGYMVACDVPSPNVLRDLRRRPPGAVVIDLSRLPSQGRDVAVALRHVESTRRVPLVFVDGEDSKVTRIRELIPDAVYTSWPRMRSSLHNAIANPPRNPVTFKSVFGAYAKTPLAKKLGITADTDVALVDAPAGFEATLEPLPEGVTIRRGLQDAPDVTIWFTTTRERMERGIERASRHVGRGGLWILWPKKTSQLGRDLTQPVVRRVAEGAGLVDYKIAAIDDTWTGLRFARR